MFRTLLAALAIGLFGTAASAAVFTLNIYQNGPDVDFIGAGTFDLAGAAFSESGSFAGPFLDPSTASYAAIGNYTMYVFNSYNDTPIGPGTSSPISSYSGDPVGIYAAGSAIYVDPAYQSFQLLNSSATIQNQTLAGLGLTDGLYKTSFGTNTVVFIVGSTGGMAAVPLPATLPLLGGAVLVGATFLRRRTRRQTPRR